MLTIVKLFEIIELFQFDSYQNRQNINHNRRLSILIKETFEHRTDVTPELDDKCGRVSWPEEDLDVQGQAHDLVGCEQGPCGEVGAGARAGAAGPSEGVRRVAGLVVGLVSHGGVAEAVG